MLVLDTHALIWLDQDHPSLGAQARQQADLALQQGVLAVSAITFWETAMLAGKGRITMTLPIDIWRKDLLGNGLLEIPVDGGIGIHAAELNLHGDPADRLILATCLSKGAALLTADLTLLDWRGDLECINAKL